MENNHAKTNSTTTINITTNNHYYYLYPGSIQGIGINHGDTANINCSDLNTDKEKLLNDEIARLKNRIMELESEVETAKLNLAHYEIRETTSRKKDEGKIRQYKFCLFSLHGELSERSITYI